MFEIRIHGRGGQGVVTAAELLSVAAFVEGRHAQAFPSFGSERTGAPVVAFCRIAETEIRTREPIVRPDAVLVQAPTLLHQVGVFGGLRSEDGYLLLNSARGVAQLGLAENAAGFRPGRCLVVPATEVALTHVGRPQPNAAMLDAWGRSATPTSPPPPTRSSSSRRRSRSSPMRRQLEGSQAVAEAVARCRPATFDHLNTWYYSDASATVRPELDAARRTSTFDEVVGGLDESNALFEARRCLSCGNCFECDNCYGVCPDNAVIKLGAGQRYRIDYDYCKGCGICATECPCGAIGMVPEET